MILKPRGSFTMGHRDLERALNGVSFEFFASHLLVPDKKTHELFRMTDTEMANPLIVFDRERTGRDVVLKHRQIGFTMWELARDLWFFLTRNVNVMIVTPDDLTHSATTSIHRKIKDFVDQLRKEFDIDCVPHSDGFVSAVKGSRIHIVGLSGKPKKLGHGVPIHRLHITECAWIDDCDFLTAMMSCVPSVGAEVMIESSPRFDEGMFYETYHAAKAGLTGYKSHFIDPTKETDDVTCWESLDRVKST